MEHEDPWTVEVDAILRTVTVDLGTKPPLGLLRLDVTSAERLSGEIWAAARSLWKPKAHKAAST